MLIFIIIIVIYIILDVIILFLNILLYFFRLKTIDLFESCSIQLGDTHWYKIKDTDKFMTMKQWRNKCTEAFFTGSKPLSTTKKDKPVNKPQNTKNLSKNTDSHFRLGYLDSMYTNFNLKLKNLTFCMISFF